MQMKKSWRERGREGQAPLELASPVRWSWYRPERLSYSTLQVVGFGLWSAPNQRS